MKLDIPMLGMAADREVPLNTRPYGELRVTVQRLRRHRLKTMQPYVHWCNATIRPVFRHSVGGMLRLTIMGLEWFTTR